MLITEERLRKALTYLSETDQPFAQAKAYMKGMEEQRKTVKARLYLKQEGTNTDRTEKAYAHTEYAAHLKKLELGTYDYEILRNKRLTEEMIVEVWRSLNSARSKGNIT